ncbi:MAG: hypothetical protein US30_C0002G0013 [Candidatus Moranbacteria bacterium GW2011_GWF2_36_839]|nr:MAG: hypothetical protein US27_C0003G0013 [Candidatus Moranbacteria bacterium GW2011_GWF1_36_78]KKQ17553.1 MAG: hypothetical protein US30_C0002G0013 [Candidatus Moranbacteria bacterium GW2011_GWF2_36_839]HAT74278.1 hypothetical protein [Candidatus Moranbacteria bacterium]HBY10943.1 hypothetical protein [Candidatus Moranbacteria bacterium]
MSCNITSTRNKYLDKKPKEDQEQRYNFIYEGVNADIIGKKISDATEKRRKIINDLDIEIGDVINRNGRKNKILGFTRDFLLIFDKGDRIDSRSILLLGFKIIKK